MNLLSTLGAALLLATTLTAQAATIPVFEDNFDDSSYDSNGDFANWDTTYLKPQRVTCGPDALGCLRFEHDGSINSLLAGQIHGNAISILAGKTYAYEVILKNGFAGASATIDVFSSMLGGILNPTHFFLVDGEDYTFSGTYLSSVDQDIYISLRVDASNDIFGGFDLDSVRLSEVSMVPVPASAPLMLAGLGVIGALRWRWRRSPRGARA